MCGIAGRVSCDGDLRRPVALTTSAALGAGPEADRVSDDELAVVYLGEVYDSAGAPVGAA